MEVESRFMKAVQWHMKSKKLDLWINSTLYGPLHVVGSIEHAHQRRPPSEPGRSLALFWLLERSLKKKEGSLRLWMTLNEETPPENERTDFSQSVSNSRLYKGKALVHSVISVGSAQISRSCPRLLSISIRLYSLCLWIRAYKNKPSTIRRWYNIYNQFLFTIIQLHVSPTL